MTSPLRYPGGKTRARKKLDIIFSENFDAQSINRIVSPFFGGGSFELSMHKTYNKPIIANDKFKPLLNFWEQVKTNADAVINRISDNRQVSKEKFQEFRRQVMDCQDPVEQGMMYFIINRCSFSGATLSGGFSETASTQRFTDSSIERVRCLKLTDIEFHNEDFKTFIPNNVKYDDFVFLDPPYFLEKGNKLYGNNGDMHEDFDHLGLREVLRGVSMWMMTYNDCDYIRQLYEGYAIIEVDWAYGMNATKKSSEIVIIHK
tara:strand:- start:8611 stop:9390 length:780 start_codon:yes stop_codon:yes gene_type:complete